MQYLQQLAIITPYAQLELEYHNHANPKKDLTAVYRRRSEQMPPLAYEVKHHPGSVNNLLVQQLIHRRAFGAVAPAAWFTRCGCACRALQVACVSRVILISIFTFCFADGEDGHTAFFVCCRGDSPLEMSSVSA